MVIVLFIIRELFLGASWRLTPWYSDLIMEIFHELTFFLPEFNPLLWEAWEVGARGLAGWEASGRFRSSPSF